VGSAVVVRPSFNARVAGKASIRKLLRYEHLLLIETVSYSNRLSYLEFQFTRVLPSGIESLLHIWGKG